MKKDFKEFIETLNEDLFSWDYFVDFEKVKENTFEIKVYLNILNSLLGENDVENKFIELVKKYPEVRSSLLILISTRIKKIKEIKIINTDTLISEYRYNLFEKDHKLTLADENELLHFLRATGLKEIFENKYISDLNDYVFGVEVGLDSHARKNRSGDLMELIVHDILDNFVKENENFAFVKQANSAKIKDVLGYEVKKHINDRISDFALMDQRKNKLYLIEVNLYGSGGTKLKSVAGEFEKVNNFILGQDIDFVWVSDGVGWKTAEKPMMEAFENNKYTFNLKQFKEFLLEISNGR